MGSTHVTLTLGGTTIEINGPQAPTDVVCPPQYATARAQSGKLWAYKGSDRYYEQWAMRFGEITGDQWQLLNNFFYEVVGGPNVPFTYVHTDGVSYEAYFLDTDLSGSRQNDAYSTQFRLELAAQHVDVPAS